MSNPSPFGKGSPKAMDEGFVPNARSLSAPLALISGRRHSLNGALAGRRRVRCKDNRIIGEDLLNAVARFDAPVAIRGLGSSSQWRVTRERR